ncbi:MAG: CHASE3 domain-containing protein [Pseudomonadota bacterium]|nr:CHASE3 domain-containing protein [Pseudomonadota bacterium]
MLLKDIPGSPEPAPRMRISRRMRAALVVGFVGAGAMILINESAHMQTTTALADVRMAHELRANVKDMLLELTQAESAQRGFALTGDRAYLDPYEASKQRIGELQAHFEDMAAQEEKPLQKQAQAFSKAVSQKFGEMDLTVRLREEEKLDAVNFVVTTNVGLQQMQNTRALADGLTNAAQERISRDRAEVYRLLNVSRFGLAAGILAALLAFVLYTQQTRQMQRNEENSKRALEAERDALESQVKQRTTRLTELANHLQQAVEVERAHLARELHDELGALLTAAKLDVARLKSRLPADPPELAERLKHLTDILNQGIALKRRIIEDLRPSSLSNLGLVASLEILTREFGERLRIELETALEPVDLDENSELTIYRMVQESLTNIGKYAGASHVRVALQNYTHHAEVTVTDDGIGFDPGSRPQASHGLAGMRHRIEACGGRLDVNSAAGKGTRITATIPRRQAKAQSELARSLGGASLSAASYRPEQTPPTTPGAAG